MPYIPKQYESARAFLKGYSNLGNITDPLDNMRLMAYNLYDDFYYNRPETFRVTRRGDSDVEIYVPSTKKIVGSTARFLAVDFDYTLTGGDVAAVRAYLESLWPREEITKRHIKGKRSGLTRGDLVWYITADRTKPKGERISLNTIHPSSVFRIEDPNNTFRTIGYHLVDIVPDPREVAIGNRGTQKKVARRQTFRKENGRITSECYTFEIGAWDDRNLKRDELKPVTRLWDKYELPEQITQLPVYHIPNEEPDGSTWGMSQVAGIEYLINAMNQSITYEDLSLVLQGLGVYVTTAAPPIDKATGKKKPYRLHPGNVVEMSQGDTFERVTGVASVAPFQDHIKSLDAWATIGLPDMATGNVDVSVAQSGIALALKMGPVLAENEDKEETFKNKYDQLFYDLIRGWLPAFEELDSRTTVFKTTFGDPMPVNRETFISETVDLFTSDMITYDEMRERLEKVGYSKLSGAEQKLLDQAAKKADANGGQATLANPEGQPDLLDSLGDSVNGNDPQLQLVT
ncbi:portal protein [Mycobacterium phage Indlulamithi]|uniref:Portal protein n=1 Tax=Mycobacterium phage Indlulamithi TaxID=2656582 RepID=A0A649VE36_9CAUD|nr:portal protein [Mycobacterium phage Indlulamithi]QGJ90043.1 portal protein [Mycobacterium phage Indlulamithi]